MADEKFTRCPGCKTIFRVTPQQLAMRSGQVRCGHCRTVFDGEAALISLAPQFQEEPELDEIAMGPPTVTLRSSQALQSAPAPAPVEHEEGAPIDEREEAAAEDAEASADPPIDYSSRFSWQEQKARRRVPRWLIGLAIPVLLALLAAQALFHFRDAVAAHWPTTRQAMVRLCALAACEVRPMADISALSIEASDLQADPAHRGLLVLTTTIRNRSTFAQAYPYFELTLSDTQDQVVVRRAFAPREYLNAAADPQAGIAGNAELAIKLFIDASATTQAGYQVYLFYP